MCHSVVDKSIECVVDEPVDGVEVPGVSLHQLALEAHVPIKVMS